MLIYSIYDLGMRTWVSIRDFHKSKFRCKYSIICPRYLDQETAK